jgi:hypothetical protein
MIYVWNSFTILYPVSCQATKAVKQIQPKLKVIEMWWNVKTTVFWDVVR